MKQIVLIVCFLFSASIFFAQNTDDFSKKERAVIKVIEQETEGWWQRDYDKWSNTWARKDYILWSGTTQESHLQYDSWEELSAFVKESFAAYPNPDLGDITRKDWQIRIYKNAAWVRFVQDAYSVTTETRMLEKVNGEWKLVYLGWINKSSYEEETSAMTDN